jgi:hypothetical protein
MPNLLNVLGFSLNFWDSANLTSAIFNFVPERFEGEEAAMISEVYCTAMQ